MYFANSVLVSTRSALSLWVCGQLAFLVQPPGKHTTRSTKQMTWRDELLELGDWRGARRLLEHSLTRDVHHDS